MKYKCPVCYTEYSENVTKCEVCDFTDKLGIDRIWPTPQDAEHWLNTVVLPYREEWQHQIKEMQTSPQGSNCKNCEKEVQENWKSCLYCARPMLETQFPKCQPVIAQVGEVLQATTPAEQNITKTAKIKQLIIEILKMKKTFYKYFILVVVYIIIGAIGGVYFNIWESPTEWAWRARAAVLARFFLCLTVMISLTLLEIPKSKILQWVSFFCFLILIFLPNILGVIIGELLNSVLLGLIGGFAGIGLLLGVKNMEEKQKEAERKNVGL